MRRVFGFICLILAIIPCASFAETDIKISGQVRMKNWVDDKSLVPDTPVYYWNSLRTRVAIKAAVDSNVHAFIQLQDSREFHYGPHEEWVSGSENDIHNVDLHQAYFCIDRLLHEGISLSGGRFELSHGNERILGPNDWHDVARAWDGVQAWYKQGVFSLDFFLVAGPVSSSGQYSYETDISGYRARLEKPLIDVLLLYENEDNTEDQPIHENRYTLAAYGKQHAYSLYIEWNAAYQWGTRFVPGYGPELNVDISAYLLTGELGRYLTADTFSLLAIGTDFSSGSGVHGRTFTQFENPYYSEHRFHGFMEYFAGPVPWGLIDLYARAKVEPVKGWQVESWLHKLRTHYTYYYAIDMYHHKTGNDLGWELDFATRTSLVRGIKLEGGFGLFYPSSEYGFSLKSKTGRWAYLLTTLDF